MTVAGVRALTKTARDIAVKHELTGHSLKVSFPGQPEPTDWEVRFAR